MADPIPATLLPATLLPGDGLGPEIMDVVVRVLERLGSPFAWDVQEGGMAAIASCGDPLPPALLDSIRRTRSALKGPLTTPIGGGFRSVNVRLREEFQLYANLRPNRTMVPGGRYEDINIVVVPENLEGLYVGFEHYIPIGADPHGAAIFEAVHGSAPDIAGKGVANPLAVLMAAAWMPEHCGLHEMAGRLRAALDHTVLVAAVRTLDLGGTADTAGFAGAVLQAL